MSLLEAQRLTGGLSSPSKMPGHGYSLPAVCCKIGSFLREKVPGSVCEKCYARKGRYAFPNVKNALQKRLDSLDHPEWPNMMEKLIAGTKEKHFRWHDSGDLQSVRHLQRIVRIAEKMPQVSFWLPTKEYGIVLEYLKIAPEGFPENLTVRLSSLLNDVSFEEQQKVENLQRIKAIRLIEDMSDGKLKSLPTSAVLKEVEGLVNHLICPAPTTEGKCGDCRACWDKKVKNIAYHYH